MCKHGLDSRFCAVCNHATFDRPPFTGRKPDDETPRFKKGRDSAAWVGIGQRFDSGSGHHALARAIPREPVRSTWAETQALRNLQDLTQAVSHTLPTRFLHIPATPRPSTATPAEPVKGTTETLVWGDRTIQAVREFDYDTRTRFPKDRYRPTAQKIKHAVQKRTQKPSFNR